MPFVTCGIASLRILLRLGLQELRQEFNIGDSVMSMCIDFRLVELLCLE